MLVGESTISDQYRRYDTSHVMYILKKYQHTTTPTLTLCWLALVRHGESFSSLNLSR